MQVEATQCPLRFAPAFDKDVLPPPSSLTKLSSGLLAKPYKITQGFKMEPTSMCPRRVEVVRQSDSFETLLLQPYAVRVICALAAEKEAEIGGTSVIAVMMLFLFVVSRLDNFVVPFGGAIPKN